MRTLLLTFLTFLLLIPTSSTAATKSSTATPRSFTAVPKRSTAALSSSTTAFPNITPTSDDTIKIEDAIAVEGLTILCGNTKLTTNAEGEFKCPSLPNWCMIKVINFKMEKCYE